MAMAVYKGVGQRFIGKWIIVDYVVQDLAALEAMDSWLQSDEAAGYYWNQLGVYFDKRATIRLSDPATAFAFKMRFG